MIIGFVKGHVVSSAKVENLEGKKLLVVEILSPTPDGFEHTDQHMVCVDAVQAGEGSVVIVVQGSSARIAPGMADVPVDALVIGIVDSVQAFGQQAALEIVS